MVHFKGTTIRAVAAAEGSKIGGVRLEWEGYPQCALMNGVGGPDDHTANAAAPFIWEAPPQSYATVFRQTYPFLYKAGQWSLNSNTPAADNYAALDQIESFRPSTSTTKPASSASASASAPTKSEQTTLNKQSNTEPFEFEMRWPNILNETVMWSQTSNPSLHGNVTGYTPLNNMYAGSFLGLSRVSSALQGDEGAMLKGTADPTWFFAIGWNGMAWGENGIPAATRASELCLCLCHCHCLSLSLCRCRCLSLAFSLLLSLALSPPSLSCA